MAYLLITMLNVKHVEQKEVLIVLIVVEFMSNKQYLLQKK